MPTLSGLRHRTTTIPRHVPITGRRTEDGWTFETFYAYGGGEKVSKSEMGGTLQPIARYKPKD